MLLLSLASWAELSTMVIFFLVCLQHSFGRADVFRQMGRVDFLAIIVKGFYFY
jgi:hypothetical protein